MHIIDGVVQQDPAIPIGGMIAGAEHVHKLPNCLTERVIVVPAKESKNAMSKNEL